MNLLQLIPTYRFSIYWKRAAQLAVSLVAGLIVANFLVVNWPQYAALTIRWPWLLAAGLCMTISKWFFSMGRYRKLINRSTIRISNYQLVRLYGIGIFLNQFLPGGFGGDMYKIWHLKKNNESTIHQAGLLTIKDRIYGLVAIVHFSVVIATWILFPIHILSIGLTILIFIILIWQVIKWISSKKSLRNSSFSLYAYSLFIQLFQCSMVFCILQAFNCSDSWMAYILLFLVSSIATALPITIGGIGIREFIFALGSTSLHVNRSDAILVGFCVYCLSLLTALPGCLFLFNTDKVTEY